MSFRCTGITKHPLHLWCIVITSWQVILHGYMALNKRSLLMWLAHCHSYLSEVKALRLYQNGFNYIYIGPGIILFKWYPALLNASCDVVIQSLAAKSNSDYCKNVSPYFWFVIGYKKRSFLFSDMMQNGEDLWDFGAIFKPN